MKLHYTSLLHDQGSHLTITGEAAPCFWVEYKPQSKLLYLKLYIFHRVWGDSAVTSLLLLSSDLSQKRFFYFFIWGLIWLNAVYQVHSGWVNNISGHNIVKMTEPHVTHTHTHICTQTHYHTPSLPVSLCCVSRGLSRSSRRKFGW